MTEVWVRPQCFHSLQAVMVILRVVPAEAFFQVQCRSADIIKTLLTGVIIDTHQGGNKRSARTFSYTYGICLDMLLHILEHD